MTIPSYQSLTGNNMWPDKPRNTQIRHGPPPLGGLPYASIVAAQSAACTNLFSRISFSGICDLRLSTSHRNCQEFLVRLTHAHNRILGTVGKSQMIFSVPTRQRPVAASSVKMALARCEIGSRKLAQRVWRRRNRIRIRRNQMLVDTFCFSFYTATNWHQPTMDQCGTGHRCSPLPCPTLNCMEVRSIVDHGR